MTDAASGGSNVPLADLNRRLDSVLDKLRGIEVSVMLAPASPPQPQPSTIEAAINKLEGQLEQTLKIQRAMAAQLDVLLSGGGLAGSPRRFQDRGDEAPSSGSPETHRPDRNPADAPSASIAERDPSGRDAAAIAGRNSQPTDQARADAGPVDRMRVDGPAHSARAQPADGSLVAGRVISATAAVPVQDLSVDPTPIYPGEMPATVWCVQHSVGTGGTLRCFANGKIEISIGDLVATADAATGVWTPPDAAVAMAPILQALDEEGRAPFWLSGLRASDTATNQHERALAFRLVQADSDKFESDLGDLLVQAKAWGSSARLAGMISRHLVSLNNAIDNEEKIIDIVRDESLRFSSNEDNFRRALRVGSALICLRDKVGQARFWEMLDDAAETMMPFDRFLVMSLAEIFLNHPDRLPSMSQAKNLEDALRIGQQLKPRLALQGIGDGDKK